MTDEPPRVNVLGVSVSAVNLAQALSTIQRWIEEGKSKYVCVAAAHSVLDTRKDRELVRIFNRSGMTTPDGMSLVWLLRAHGYSQVTRVYGPDLMVAACKSFASFGYRHYFYGGQDDVTDRLIEHLVAQVPDVRVAGVFQPPFRSLMQKEDSEIIETINVARPDIVWVGIGSPKQERWMAKHLGEIEAPVMIGVGAAFDLLSGRKPQAAPWMQRSGLEWLFRLASEPRRLWRRYAEYPWFLLLLLAQLSKIKKFEMED